MRRYWMVVFGLLALFTALFVVFEEALRIPLLQDPTPTLSGSGAGAALAGVGLLVVDVFIPVPSSVVMIAHGALFGVLLGTVLSVLGSVGAAALGFWVGRRGGKLLARIVSQEEAMQASTLLTRWGGLAIIVSRPIPILAETVAIMAGASSMRWRVLLVSSAAGALPAALLYALTGATAARLDNFLLTFGLVMAMAALFWALGRLFTPAATPLPKESSSQ